MRIALDVMGGDNAPDSSILGAKLFIEATPDSQSKIIFVGPKSIIQDQINNLFSNINPDRFEIYNANDIVTMDEEKPAFAFKNKPDSSLVQAVKLVKKGAANAVISAGNTAALLSSSLFLLGKIDGIKRPALATYIPSKNNGFILCDVGANTDVRPIHLMQFAIMASDYVKYIEKIDNPKIALLNIGTERNKGNKLTSETYPLLEDNLENFIGNIESRDLLEGKADVAICDGFTGNAILKLIEGIVNHFYQSLKINQKISESEHTMNSINNIFSKYNYEEHGASPFLGVKGIVLKCHGSCTELSIKNALLSAEIFYKNKIIDKIEEDLNKKKDLFERLASTNNI